MLDIILFILLILGFLIGLKRGFILQIFHLLGFIVAFIVAWLYFRDLASVIELWIPNPNLSDDHFWSSLAGNASISDAFYNGIAFVFIFFVVKILLQVLANMLDFVANIPILKSVNNLLGAIVGFIEMYLIIFFFIFFVSLVSIGFIQDAIQGSFIAQFIIESTPLFSERIKDLWFTQINS
ncbi:CvpA family protein [Halalkalibacillus halophilus]|uniref:CvpA family protein n=1 Tax=Halalkalibacillus halophilus TaxID=392827 RepID=UPI0003F9FA73|nr:CvpA family protein [Halalkalibacillus halophilus]